MMGIGKKKKLFSIRELIRANFLRFIDMDLPARWHVLNKMYKLPNTRHQHSFDIEDVHTGHRNRWMAQIRLIDRGVLALENDRVFFRNRMTQVYKRVYTVDRKNRFNGWFKHLNEHLKNPNRYRAPSFRFFFLLFFSFFFIFNVKS